MPRSKVTRSKKNAPKTGRTPEQISEIMRRVHGENTSPEVVFRKRLWAKGLRYGLHSKKLPGKPDIVIPSRQLAIFVDGDFWHGNQWRLRGLASLEEQFEGSKQRNYWLRKIRRNMDRDCRVTAELTQLGWKVLRFWESDIKNHVESCVDIAASLTRRKRTPNLKLAPGKAVAEFFAGIGLMRLGLERHGWDVVFANDIDPKKREMYEAHFRDGAAHFTLGDIHELSASDVPPVILATASFPCNDLSLAGGRRGLKGKQSSAFWGFLRILSEMGNQRPPLVLIENVPGFLTSHGGRDFEQACLALNDLGYAVDPFMLDAAWFVPQSRQRLFLAGSSNTKMDSGRKSCEVSLETSDLRPTALVRFIESHRNVRWRVGQLPDPPKVSVKLQNIVEPLPGDAPEWWSKDRAAYLYSQMSDRHRVIAEEMVAGKRLTFGTIFRRVRNGKTMAELRADGVAGCLRTPRGGSGRQILFVAGRGAYKVRLLTPRECARLMGADDYTLSGRQNQALFGFGDAVCVPVIEWIAKYYLNPLVNEMIHVNPQSYMRKVKVKKEQTKP